MYRALRPIKFDKQYFVNDTIDEKNVFSSVALFLISAGLIEKIKEDEQQPKPEAEMPEVAPEVEAPEVEAPEVEAPEVEEKEGEALELGFSMEKLMELNKTELQNLLTVNGISFQKNNTKEELAEKFLFAQEK